MNLLQYFNTPEVRKAFHVNEKLKEVTPFSNFVSNNWQSPLESSNWIYDLLILNGGYRLLHITSNVDAILSGTGAWKWIKKRKLSVKTPWTPWVSKDQQLIGYRKEYDKNFTYLTIHGNGHNGFLDRFDIAPGIVINFMHDLPIF